MRYRRISAVEAFSMTFAIRKTDSAIAAANIIKVGFASTAVTTGLEPDMLEKVFNLILSIILVYRIL